uniref:hypothetical protein n=1 Tax=uncultured Erythrobacter sp. TaxID=263913 RepID=UPI002628BCC8|nr:hypothetical protein [uncultured Erythrobacter sp.]
MLKTSHLPSISPPSHPRDRDAYAHQREWQAHIDAGRIGRGPSITPEQLAQIAHNERVLLGR